MTEKKRNPDWTRDEHLVALDYYIDNRDDYFSPTSAGVEELAANISRVAKVLGLTGLDTFRNPSGVSMKLLNFRSRDPQHDTKGLPQGNKLEQILWDEFAEDPVALKKMVENILNVTSAAMANGVPVLPDDDATEASEGQLLTRLHRYRERNAAIVKRKKASFFRKHGHLCCEARGFDFLKVYGERGAGFIECHHTKPVSELNAGETTKLADLVLLCANCHRMVHVARPWWTLEELFASINQDEES
ncbi:5-methylcytosine-specific restriction enzyme A [Celeribacter baekdonensis]|uniref:5-methylcytosine-specific restriction enzyme A n=1 Tax=Celeribacter baekdonensis TaxID=875171 RepID=A0A1G7S1T3_9RHOB|nr:HNH endonuclease [Celeribacter baekdonensis]SDG16978.1 5-methylcytosine-specific restriction enzyme A [Celeribacter baekdonensis]